MSHGSPTRKEAADAIKDLLLGRDAVARIARADSPDFHAGNPTSLYAQAVLKVSEAVALVEAAELIRPRFDLDVKPFPPDEKPPVGGLT